MAPDGDQRSTTPPGDLQTEVFHPEKDREPGDGNVQGLGFDIHPVVFPISVAVIGLFVAVTLALGDDAAGVYESVFQFVNRTFGWFYVLTVNVVLVALVGFALSKYGKIRLGGPEASKEFGDFAWMAMLFSAGMGIGLLFFGVAEPMYHYLSGGGTLFDYAGRTPAAGGAAIGITFFHWGLHPWAIYGLVGLGLAFFAFNRGLPLTLRSVFWPLLEDRIYGWPGHLVDLVAVFATLFGLATALGLGARQINVGIDFLTSTYLGFGVPTTVPVQVALIGLITAIATLSVAAGLDSGVRRLSTVNVYLMLALLAFVVVVGPTLFVLDSLVGGLGVYFGNFLELSFYTEAFAGAGATWQHGWTVFYWGFWIAWSPFVGLFIARISKGRTVREFVAGVLLVPSLVSFVWVAAFGGSALFVELNRQRGAIVTPLLEQSRSVALFELLASFPLTAVSATLATLLLVTFFVTSSDSGSLVVDHLTSGGKHEVPRRQRVTWATAEGVVAAVLLLGNGLGALQTAAITTGLPFAAVLLVMVYTVYRGLDHELEILESEEFSDAVDELNDADQVAIDRGSAEIVTDIDRSQKPSGTEQPADD